MKKEQKLRELAKMDGFEDVIDGCTAYISGNALLFKRLELLGCAPIWSEERPGLINCSVPAYLERFDAILPLIQKQDYKTRQRIAEELWGIHGIDSDFSEQEAWATNMMTEPQQWALALLRAKGFKL